MEDLLLIKTSLVLFQKEIKIFNSFWAGPISQGRPAGPHPLSFSSCAHPTPNPPPHFPLFFSSSSRQRSRPSTLVCLSTPTRFSPKTKCVGVTLSVLRCLVPLPGRHSTAGSGGFEATPIASRRLIIAAPDRCVVDHAALAVLMLEMPTGSCLSARLNAGGHTTRGPVHGDYPEVMPCRVVQPSGHVPGLGPSQAGHASGLGPPCGAGQHGHWTEAVGRMRPATVRWFSFLPN
jgi:hypothetical protein